MRVLYIKDRVVANIVEHDALPSEVPGADYVEEDYGAQVGDAAERPYLIAEIEHMERGHNRAVREAILTGDTTRLAALEAQIAAVRARLNGG